MDIKKVISGGQTGADMGGLIGAVESGLDYGGWAPKGWKTEVGKRERKLRRFKLQEYPREGYPARTRMNVWDSDGTVWFGKTGSPGYKCTSRCCADLVKPMLVISEFSDENDRVRFLEWLSKHKIKVLNVAGNRESSSPGIEDAVATFIVEALEEQEDG